MERSKEEIIKEKTEEIEKLKRELHFLKDPCSIKNLVRHKYIYNVDYQGTFGLDSNWGCGHTWDSIRRLCIELFRGKHIGEKYIRINNLTHEETEIAADFADEVLDVWDRYMLDIYGNEKDEVKEDAQETK